jgi:hypothetical protein
VEDLNMTEIVAQVGVALAVFGSIGATVRWAAAQFRAQGEKLAKLESEYAALYREHSLVLVRIERFRLAFQMVASELSRKSPGNIALVHAKALLDESFRLEPDLPSDLKSVLARLDARAAEQAAA